MPLNLRLRSLRTQIVAWSFVPTALILLAVALVAFYAYQQSTADLMLQQSDELTRLSASQLTTHLRDYADTLDGAARTFSTVWADKTALGHALQDAANRLVTFDAGVVALDNYGRVLGGQPPRPELIGQNWSDRAFFGDVLRSRGPVYSDVVHDGPGGTAVIVTAVPVTSDRGEMLGTLAGMFRIGATTTSSLYGSIIRVRTAPNVRTAIVDSQGRIIYHPDAERIGEVQPDAAEESDPIVVTSRAPIPGTSWDLVRETSWSALLEPTRPYRNFLIGLLALGVLVPALVVALGVRRITEPINRVTHAAQEVAGGKFGEIISSSSAAEVQRLVEQFNSMSRQLAKTYDDLRRKNEQLELVMEGSNDGIWDWDLRSKELYLSPRWKTMLGYDEEELANSPDTWPMLAHPDDAAGVGQKFDAYLAGHIPSLQFEHRMRHKDGSYRWLLVRGIALRDESGQPYRIAGSNADITELKRTQGILHAQSQLLEGVATGADLDDRLRDLVLAIEEYWPHSRCVVWITDGDTGNLAAAASGAISTDVLELVQKSQFSMGNEAPSGMAVRLKQRVVVEDIATDPRWDSHPQIRELALSHDLRAAWAEPIMSTQGVGLGSFSVYYPQPHKTTANEVELIRSAAHLVGVAIESRRAEQALRQSELRFRSLFESADVGIIISDMSGELLDANPALTRILGLTIDDLRTLPPDAYIHPEDDLASRGLIQELHSGKRQRYQIERRYRHKNGEQLWGRLTVTLARGLNSKPVYRIAMIEDISEQRRAQEELQSAYLDLENRVQERTRALVALNSIASVVSRSLDVREIAGNVLEASTQVAGMKHGVVCITDESDFTFKHMAQRNHSPRFCELVEALDVDTIFRHLPTGQDTPIVWSVDDPVEEELKEVIRADGLATAVIVPLISKDHLAGIMTLGSDQTRVLTQEELSLLMAIGRQIGVGMENAMLYGAVQERRDEAERRRRVAEGLREVLSVLNSRQSLQETLDLIAAQACQVLGSDASTLMRLNPEDGIMAPQAHYGLSQEFVSFLRIKRGTAASGRALEERRAVLVSDTAAFLAQLRENDDLPRSMPVEVVEQIVRVFGALLTVPVMIGDEPYGALSLYYHRSRSFSQEDIDLVQTMADQAALAIEAARLRDQAKTSAAAEERNRLARELHDSVTQNLYSVTLYAEAAARLLTKGAVEPAAEHMRNLRDTAQEALRDMRLLIFELRPMDLQKMGLAGALQARLQAVETRGGIAAELQQEGVEYMPLVPASTQEELYHIAQEALNNTLKHSRARQVLVSLGFSHNSVRLQVHDDGQGFVVAEADESGGFGFRGMRERAQRIAGCLTIDSAPGQGTTITVEVPVHDVGFQS